MNDERREKIIKGFNAAGFDYKGTYYKPMTLRTLSILEQIKSPFIIGGEQIRGLLDYLFISSNDNHTILKSIRENTWEESILDFAEGFQNEDILNLSQLIANETNNVGASIVEVIESSDKKK